MKRVAVQAAVLMAAIASLSCAFGMGMQFGENSRPRVQVGDLDATKFILYMTNEGKVAISEEFVLHASKQILEKRGKAGGE